MDAHHLFKLNVVNGLIVNGMQQHVLIKYVQITQQKINVKMNANGKEENVSMERKYVQICQQKKVVQTWLDVDGKIVNVLNSLNVLILLSLNQKDVMY